jgi:murein L,D-transpeptidase YcbB/YkuD
VGRADWPTPLISDAISAIELNPYWNIPPRIARQEVIPRIIRDPEYLRSRGIRVLSLGEAAPRELDPAQIDWTSVGGGALPFRLRQDPGPQNAMGLVKFRLNNPHHIFLHDTPARQLFDNAKRNLSHGCVRVQGALDLAKLILEARSDLPPNGLEQALEGDAPVVIRLRAPLPVHLVVISAWVDEDGTVNFRNDPTRDTAEKSCIASLNTIAGNN